MDCKLKKKQTKIQKLEPNQTKKQQQYQKNPSLPSPQFISKLVSTVWFWLVSGMQLQESSLPDWMLSRRLS